MDADTVRKQAADLLAAVEANTSATAAVAQYVEGLKNQVVELKSALDAATNGGTTSPPAETFKELSDSLGALIDSINADTAATAALANTENDPAEPVE